MTAYQLTTCRNENNCKLHRRKINMSLENKLLLIFINFNLKTSNLVALKTWYFQVLSYVFQVTCKGTIFNRK